MNNYQKKIDALIKMGAIPKTGVYSLDVKHDAWCGVFDKRECDCDPDIQIIQEFQVKPTQKDEH